MLVYKKGNLLDAAEDIICHQCNTEGIFGGGLALQIKNRYPECELVAMEAAKANKLGIVAFYRLPNGKRIANCFSQNRDFTTNYDELKKVFSTLLYMCHLYHHSIAIPYKYGCGIAKGDWETVSNILSELSDNYKIDINIYQLEESDNE